MYACVGDLVSFIVYLLMFRRYITLRFLRLSLGKPDPRLRLRRCIVDILESPKRMGKTQSQKSRHSYLYYYHGCVILKVILYT